MGPSQVVDGCRGSAPAPIGWARRPSGGPHEGACVDRTTDPTPGPGRLEPDRPEPPEPPGPAPPPDPGATGNDTAPPLAGLLDAHRPSGTPQPASSPPADDPGERLGEPPPPPDRDRGPRDAEVSRPPVPWAERPVPQPGAPAPNAGRRPPETAPSPARPSVPTDQRGPGRAEGDRDRSPADEPVRTSSPPTDPDPKDHPGPERKADPGPGQKADRGPEGEGEPGPRVEGEQGPDVGGGQGPEVRGHPGPEPGDHPGPAGTGGHRAAT